MPEPKDAVSRQKEALRLSNKESNELTRACIETSLILLMKQKQFGEISITEIVRRAGVSRTAYYRNYDSKEHILKSIMQEISERAIAQMDLSIPIANTSTYWLGLFTTIQTYGDQLQVLFKAGMGDEILEQIYRKMLAPIDAISVDSAENRYKSHFWSGAIYGITSAWVRTGLQETTEEMAGYAYRLVRDIGNECEDG